MTAQELATLVLLPSANEYLQARARARFATADGKIAITLVTYAPALGLHACGGACGACGRAIDATDEPSILRLGDRRVDDLVANSDYFPLTQRQTLMWLDRQLFPRAPYHNFAPTIRLSGPLDVERFEHAYRQTVLDIDQLRLQIDVVLPRQRILSDSEAFTTLDHVDLRSCPETLSRWLGRRIARPFDFSRPPVDAALIRLAPDENVFYLGQHHIITDGMSFLYAFDQLADHYSGRPTQARPTFRDYVDFEAAYRASPRAAHAAAFWERKLAGGVPPLRYYGRPARGRSLAVERTFIECGSDRTDRLARVGASDAVNLLGAEFSRLIALATVMFAFMHRTTGNRELVLAMPIANRSHSLGSTCGLLMEQLFLKVEIGDDETFASLARKVRADLVASLRHGQYCLSDRGLDFAFFNVIRHMPKEFVGLRAEVAYREAWAFESASQDITEGESRNAFSIQIHELSLSKDLVLGLDLHMGIFDPPMREAARSHFLRLLDAFLADVDSRIGIVDLLDPESRAHLLTVGRGPAPENPAPDLVSVIADQAARRNGHVAVIAGATQLTYRSLWERSSRLAGRLRALGVNPGSRVAICLPRGADEILTMLATLQAGATYVPIDAGHPAERVHMILEDAAPEILVTHRALISIVGASAGVVPALLVLDEAWPEIERESAAAPVSDHANRLAYILFTSGSTGRPKGVEVGRPAFSNFLRSMAHTPGLAETDRLLAITTTTFDISGLELFLPLYVGGTVAIADRETTQDPRRLRQQLEQEPINVLQATPATWRLLIEAGWRGGKPLKMLCGGEALSASLATDLLGRGTELWNMYGPTETTVWSTLKRIESGFDAITIGGPIDNTEVHVVDESLGLVPAGIVGEIMIGGQGLARGYHGRADLTSERFVTGLRDVPGGRFYRTGDLGRRLATGDLECLGRADHQVKIRGFRIELGEIESVLRAVPGVREVLVLSRSDGPGDPRLIAYWVGSAERQELADGARVRLPQYMQPSGYVKLDEFPLNANGKIDRKALPPPDDNGAPRQQMLMPRSDHEARVAAIWRDLLGLVQVGVDQDFFSLGGTSVLAIDLRERIEKEVGVEIPLAAFFESPTIESLASRIRDDPRASSPDAPIVVELRRGAAGREPLFCLLGVQLYQALALALPDDRPVVGMHQPFRYRPGTDPRPSIADMAAGYAKLIRQRQARGPYYLAGFCLGGIVAYETARQLEAQGEKIELVVVFDGMLPGAKRTNQLERIRSYVHAAVTDPRQIPAFVGRAMEGRLARLPWLQRLWPGTKPFESERLVDVTVDDAGAKAEVNRFAATIRGTAARLLVVRATAENRPVWIDLAPHLGWMGLSDRLLTRDVASTHADLLHEPYVRGVATAISDALASEDSRVEEKRAVASG